METKEKKTPEVKKNTWEYKDRNYYLIKGEPLTYTLPSRHSARYPLVWFDEKYRL